MPQTHGNLYIYPMRCLTFFFLLLTFPVSAQISKDSAAFFIRGIYRHTYQELKSYEWLTTLTKEVGPRLSGSEGAAKGVQWAYNVLDTLGLDSVWLQEIQVPRWERGDKEIVRMTSRGGTQKLTALALGNSPGTGRKGVKGDVIEVLSLDALREMPEELVRGKIVFFNRPMDAGLPSTFSAYGNAADQRTNGPAVAAQKGAVAAVVRSLTTLLNDYPHTGTTLASESMHNIPSVAISTIDAELLSKTLRNGPVSLFIRTTCGMKEEAVSHNVIGEIRGSEFPEEIILIGGHLDSWDVGEGAHDDGSGCVHSIEVLYRLLKSGYQQKRTIRCVLFMNEENGLRGGKKYAEVAIAKKEFHLAAIESDGGGATPQGFGCSAGEGVDLNQTLAFMGSYINLLEPYYLQMHPGGGGADIGPLRPTAGLLIGLRPDNARYFDYHHSVLDVLEAVHPRELAGGAAALTSLIFLIDQYGIGQ